MKEQFLVLLLFICCLHINGKDAEPQEYRLDEKVIPKRYRILLTLKDDFSATKKYSGNTAIDVEIKEPTNTIKLNALALEGLDKNNITISEIASPTTSLVIESVSFSKQYEILTIKTKENLTPTFYTLNFNHFEGELSENSMHGFYKSTYKKGNQTR